MNAVNFPLGMGGPGARTVKILFFTDPLPGIAASFRTPRRFEARWSGAPAQGLAEFTLRDFPCGGERQVHVELTESHCICKRIFVVICVKLTEGLSICQLWAPRFPSVRSVNCGRPSPPGAHRAGGLPELTVGDSHAPENQDEFTDPESASCI